ncbi:membrane protein YfhO [Streptomyces sp. DvalAA-14]|uniref:YfhO family protein n=1 Tax=unclassified Streptomyces TaxID=2593676 RepID=UPI00081B9634|nr:MULTISPECIES: YfhO family protein [unclassified Streptomyces]MYS23929.1 YfhO family protein [Streptomyces sp. SID4948]SCE40621.1 membrane protein YfhO [Streptomyces sp. DvalAA-14]
MTSEHIGRLRAALFAAGLTMVAFCAGDAAARQYPFGSRTRDVSDLGNQYLPFHAHLWDLLHGKADGGWLLNWQSGYGSSFLPDFGTYLSSPFAPLVALFPRDRIDLAVYVISMLKLGSAAAAMAVLLLLLRPGPRWAAGMLGASYALCGWTLMLASYNTMWLDGLIAFPLLCVVGEWARTGRRPIAGVLVVALCWAANFYTAYMATIGAALFLAARLLTEPPPGPEPAAPTGDIADPAGPAAPARPASTPARGRHAAVTFGRAALTTALGIGLTAPVLLTIVKGTKLASPVSPVGFHQLPVADLLIRMLPGTYGFFTPSTYVDTAALLLAFVLPFHPAVPRRARIVWPALVVVVAGSLDWRPTHLLWHAFTTPNGSPYRQTFVLSGIMVIAAWQSLAHRLPGPRQLVCGAGLMGLMTAFVAVDADRGLTGPATYPLLAAGLVAAVGALLLLRRLADRGIVSVRGSVPAVLAVGVLLATQFGQSAVSNAWIDHKRPGLMDDYPEWGPRQTLQRQSITAADTWPGRRTDPGREQTVGNDPLEVGGQGAQYYSSLTSEVWISTLAALGGGWTSYGRSPQSLDNPVTDVIFSVGARLHSPVDPHLGGPPQSEPPPVTRQPVPPLVTVRAAAPATGYGRSPYRNQELLLGSRVYTPGAAIRLTDSAGRVIRPGSDGEYATPGGPHSTYKLASSCPTGSELYFWAPDFTGSVQAPGGTAVVYKGGRSGHRAPVQRLGAAGNGGPFTLKLTPGPGSSRLEADGVGCLDRARLAAAERHLAATAPTRVDVTSDGIRAQLPPGAEGFAVVAAPDIAGWSCSTDSGTSHPASSYLGLLAVPLDGRASSVSCSLTPPGLRLGEAVGGASLLGVGALAGYGWWRRRRGGAAFGSGTGTLPAQPRAESAEPVAP